MVFLVPDHEQLMEPTLELQGIYGIFTWIYQPKWLIIGGDPISTYKSIKLMAFAWNWGELLFLL